jgi:hypothetical protein
MVSSANRMRPASMLSSADRPSSTSPSDAPADAVLAPEAPLAAAACTAASRAWSSRSWARSCETPAAKKQASGRRRPAAISATYDVRDKQQSVKSTVRLSSSTTENRLRVTAPGGLNGDLFTLPLHFLEAPLELRFARLQLQLLLLERIRLLAREQGIGTASRPHRNFQTEPSDNTSAASCFHLLGNDLLVRLQCCPLALHRLLLRTEALLLPHDKLLLGSKVLVALYQLLCLLVHLLLLAENLQTTTMNSAHRTVA